MDARRIALALVVAIVVSAGATYLLWNRIRANQAAHPATTKVVAAAHALSAGAPLSGDSVRLIDWPTNVKIEGGFSKSEDVIGRSLIYPINENQPILDHDLAAAGSGIGLTVKIPEGMRAVSVRSNDVVGVAGFLYPGSHVDVLVTTKPEGAPIPLTQTILQNVEVLTAGQHIEPDPTGKPETVSVVTLLLSPQDGQRLVLATQQGTVQFVLRNGADQSNVQTKAVDVNALMVGPSEEKTKIKVDIKRVKAKVAPPPPSFYEVETIAAGKRMVDKFNNTDSGAGNAEAAGVKRP
jgi:pilus assembly protein CpaB